MSHSYFIRLFAIIVVTATAACTFSRSTFTVIDAEKARKFSDAYVDDAMNGRHDALYAKMENEFREFMSREKFGDLMRSIEDQFGRIISYTFDHDEIGAKRLFTGKTEATRKIFYKVTTTKGTYPLSVTVVKNGDDLAVTDFLFRTN